MLPIGARLSPHNRASAVVHTRALLGNVFAIRLHITLKKGRAGSLSISTSFHTYNHNK